MLTQPNPTTITTAITTSVCLAGLGWALAWSQFGTLLFHSDSLAPSCRACDPLPFPSFPFPVLRRGRAGRQSAPTRHAPPSLPSLLSLALAAYPGWRSRLIYPPGSLCSRRFLTGPSCICCYCSGACGCGCG